MCRAALLRLLLLAAPALASAQATGTILLDDGGRLPNYLNAADCAGAAVEVRWNAALLNAFTGVPVDGVYTLYASNQAPLNYACFTQSNAAIGLVAFPVATTFTPGLLSELTVSGSDLVSGYGGAIADCASSAEQVLYLCVQGTVGGAPGIWFGFATAPIRVSTARPSPPVLTSVTPADAALNVAWEPGAASSSDPAEPEQYVVEAFATGAADPLPLHVSPPTGATAYRLEGLVNGVVYAVRARAISLAGNEGDPSLALTAMPVADRATPAWRPQASSGSGGCASGAAGPLGLAVLLFALAVRPRLR